MQSYAAVLLVLAALKLLKPVVVIAGVYIYVYVGFKAICHRARMEYMWGIYV